MIKVKTLNWNKNYKCLVVFYFSTDDEIIFYCRKGTSSIQDADYVCSVGFQNAVNLQGGLDIWQKNIRKHLT